MKLKRILTLCCMLTMAIGMASSASAADYSFETSANPVYYGSTNYFEAAMLIALLGFVSSTAMAKFLLRGEVIE